MLLSLQSFKRVLTVGCVLVLATSLLILMSFSSPFNLASGGFAADLPFGTQVLEAGVTFTRNGGHKALRAWEPAEPRSAPRGAIWAAVECWEEPL